LSECDGEALVMSSTWPNGGAVTPWNAAKIQTNICAIIFTYNQQPLLQLTFANVSDLQCGPRQVEDMTTVVGNIPGKY